MKVVIVGGVAGGASCAVRLRRLSEEAQIVMLDRGPYVSFANCGLPYYVGNVIAQEKELLVATPELFRERFNIDVRVKNEVLNLDSGNRKLRIRDLDTGREYDESYDKLVLATGASPIRPPFPGLDLPGIFVLKTIPDSRKIRDWISKNKVREAVIVGGGFIGLEMAENLAGQGLKVAVVEMLDQVMPPMDREMVTAIHSHLREKGVQLVLGDGVKAFKKEGQDIVTQTQSGRMVKSQLVILSIGVRPESSLAVAAGLKLGERKGILVDSRMQTSDPAIWAVGDAVEVQDVVSGQQTLIPLAGPANRQGRVAADNIAGQDARFRGVQATAICKVFDLTVAMTGESEKSLKRFKIPYERVYLHPEDHVSYFPGAHTLHLKLLFSPENGKILGAQAVGRTGIDKRIDVISMAIQKEGTVYDLEEAELCYAPQFGAAKDPVNVAGMIAANALRGDAPLVHWDQEEEAAKDGHLLLDVRTADEFAKSHVPWAVNVPLHELRNRLQELPKDRDIHVYCGVGKRAYYATRILRLHGLRAFNLSGGFQTYRAFHETELANA